MRAAIYVRVSTEEQAAEGYSIEAQKEQNEAQSVIDELIHLRDAGEADDKIIAVAQGDPNVSHYTNISELPDHLVSETMSFFEDYKKLENKTVVVEKIFDKNTAVKILQEALIAYEEKYVTFSNFSQACGK